MPELMLAGEMMNQISAIIKPKLADMPDRERRGKVIIGTVEGDIHDIGKNIVSFMLDVNGFEVLDLGVDVPPQKFVDEIQSLPTPGRRPERISNPILRCYEKYSSGNRIAGLRDKVKIMIGGGQINEEVKEYARADGYGRDAMSGVTFAKEWVGAK